MKGGRLLLLLLLFAFVRVPAYSQGDSCHLKITLLTCGPGQDLYSVFGHSALRVTDALAHTDVIFNYGTFDFDDPDFYLNFVKGKLLYYVSVENYYVFRREYELENRSILEQDLNLSCEENERLYTALRTNAREENKYYRYEFLFDNCSTRLRDMVSRNVNDSMHFRNILPSPAPSFRDMIHMYLDKGGNLWSEFGIDLVLASRIDRKVKNEETMFLPDFLMKGFDSSLVRNTSLVAGKKTILESQPVDPEKQIFTPLAVTLALLLIGILVTLIKGPALQSVQNVFDIALYLILGIIGCFMLFMWFGTEHELCRDNYNILWALPTHLIMAFFVQKRSRFVRTYFGVAAIICVLFLLLLPVIPQGMNYAFLPLIALSAIRAGHRALKK